MLERESIWEPDICLSGRGKGAAARGGLKIRFAD